MYSNIDFLYGINSAVRGTLGNVLHSATSMKLI
jgi:hypothetical protein